MKIKNSLKLLTIIVVVAITCMVAGEQDEERGGHRRFHRFENAGKNAYHMHDIKDARGNAFVQGNGNVLNFFYCYQPVKRQPLKRNSEDSWFSNLCREIGGGDRKKFAPLMEEGIRQKRFGKVIEACDFIDEETPYGTNTTSWRMQVKMLSKK